MHGIEPKHKPGALRFLDLPEELPPGAGFARDPNIGFR
jgi:hypothetical protein